jgi:hypothetical protein
MTYVFSNQNSQLGQILEGPAMEDIGIFYGHLVYFATIWYILWTFGKVCGCLVYFSCFGMLYQEKSGNTGCSVLQTGISNSRGDPMNAELSIMD